MPVASTTRCSLDTYTLIYYSVGSLKYPDKHEVISISQVKPGTWGQLEAVEERDAIQKRRNESVDRAHARIEAARQQRLERKKKEER